MLLLLLLWFHLPGYWIQNVHGEVWRVSVQGRVPAATLKPIMSRLWGQSNNFLGLHRNSLQDQTTSTHCQPQLLEIFRGCWFPVPEKVQSVLKMFHNPSGVLWLGQIIRDLLQVEFIAVHTWIISSILALIGCFKWCISTDGSRTTEEAEELNIFPDYLSLIKLSRHSDIF